MSLIIGKQDKRDNLIELKKDSNSVIVKIDNIIIATFYGDGSFEFYGQGEDSRYDGEWNK